MPVGRHSEPTDLDARLLSAAARCFSSETDFPKVIGVMVSGGGDSMALLHLMHRAAAQCAARIEAVTVDHGLRDASAGEAATVAAFCAGLGVGHTTVRWLHGEVQGNLMDQARRARLRLVAEWAQGRGIEHVAMGHTADDQAETFLLGLSRKAGLDGLSGMRPAWRERNIFWSRPLLSFTRDDLRHYLRAAAVGWIEDPTNEDLAYARVKARRALAALKPLGITATTLSAVSNNLDTVRAALTHQIHAVALEADTTAGMVALERARYLALPDELRRRFLIAGLRWIGGADYPPRETGLTALQTAILTGRDATLAGCRMRNDAAMIRLFREPRAIAGHMVATDQIWDHRWHLEGPHADDLRIGALGAEGLRQLKDWRQTAILRDALLVSPAIWRKDALIAAPLAGFSNGWAANPRIGFASFIIAH